MADTCDIYERCADWARTAFPCDGEAERATDTPTPVARDAALYRAHTEEGAGIRALARVKGQHPSSVSRAVRRIEDRRDDPLFDRLLDGPGAPKGFEKRATTLLRRLAEPEAFLLVGEGAPRGGVFCRSNGHAKPIALVEVAHAAELVRRDWIQPVATGSASTRYKLTEAGRAALKRLLAAEAAARQGPGLAEAPSPFRLQHQIPGTRLEAAEAGGAPVARPVNIAESPLGWLARRKGADGRGFLTAAEVEAGERLRSDFEAAQMGPRITQDWSAFLTPASRGTGSAAREPAMGPEAARRRVSGALSALGPGLADAALRVCCFLEGLESCEKRMGWSARSGKVVLKIALGRLAEHYGLARGA